jgi:hypothetical protein
MATTATGILLYHTATKHTVPPVHGPYHTITYNVNIVGGISEDERYIVGTHCGTQPYSQQRVDEYIQYRQNPATVLTRFGGDQVAVSRYFHGDVVM